MKRIVRLFLGALFATSSTSSNVWAKDEVTPLFAADSPLTIEIDGPIRTIARTAEKSTDAYPGTLRANGEMHAVQIAARGNSRRRSDTCEFPPLRVTFASKPGDTSLFDSQNSLKLVTHCRPQSNFKQQVLREYAAYRLYNVLTPASLKVRLLQVRYLDGGREVADTMGFFIEDTDDAAERLGMREIDVPDTKPAALDGTAAARASLFEYMIGNNDFDLSNGPAGNDCCHNVKLLGQGKDARNGLVPVPYDFDYSGLVDAPYAVPPEQIPISSVKQRYYRGCGWRAETLGVVPSFVAARPALMSELDRIPGLNGRTRKVLGKYLDDFFEDLAEPEKTLFKRC